jgi:hypothetical protein
MATGCFVLSVFQSPTSLRASDARGQEDDNKNTQGFIGNFHFSLQGFSCGLRRFLAEGILDLPGSASISTVAGTGQAASLLHSRQLMH